MSRGVWRSLPVGALGVFLVLCCFSASAHAQALMLEHDNRQQSTTDPLVRSKGELTGFVRDRSGKPVAKVGLTLSDASVFAGAPGSSRSAFVLSDEKGHFMFPKMAGGEFKLSAMALGFLDYSASITIRADKPTKHDVVMDSLIPR